MRVISSLLKFLGTNIVYSLRIFLMRILVSVLIWMVRETIQRYLKSGKSVFGKHPSV